MDRVRCVSNATGMNSPTDVLTKVAIFEMCYACVLVTSMGRTMAAEGREHGPGRLVG